MEFKSIVEFASYLWAESISPAQVALLRAMYGLPLSKDERRMWSEYTGAQIWQRYKPREYREAICLLGRQSGKSSRIGVTAALWEALCVERDIAPGERLSVLFVAPTLRQSSFDLTVEKLRNTPALSELIETDSSAGGEVRLTNGIDLLNISANPRHARGRTAVLCVVDEAAYVRSDRDFVANLPEVLEAIRPSLIVRNGKLLLLSSPSGKEGLLFEAWQQRHENPDVLVWGAPSSAMNPAISAELLERERKRGKAYFEREYLAQFVDASNPLIPPALLDAAVVPGSDQIGRAAGDFGFVCGIDLADRNDDCAMGIACVREIDGKRKAALLFARVWKPGPNGHNVPQILREIGEYCRTFGVGFARGDQKSMSTAEHILGEYGVKFERTITDGTGSEPMYRSFLAGLHDGAVLLPQNEELLTQLRRLEEKTSDGNRFRVVGRKNSKDDLAVASVLAVSMAIERISYARGPWITSVFVEDYATGDPDERFFRSKERSCALTRNNQF